MKKFLAMLMTSFILLGTTSTVFASETVSVTQKSLIDGEEYNVQPRYDSIHTVYMNKANTFYKVCDDLNLLGEDIYAHIEMLGNDFVGSPKFQVKFVNSRKATTYTDIYEYGSEKLVGKATGFKGWQLYIRSCPTDAQIEKDSDYGTGKLSIRVHD